MIEEKHMEMLRRDQDVAIPIIESLAGFEVID